MGSVSAFILLRLRIYSGCAIYLYHDAWARLPRPPRKFFAPSGAGDNAFKLLFVLQTTGNIGVPHGLVGAHIVERRVHTFRVYPLYFGEGKPV